MESFERPRWVERDGPDRFVLNLPEGLDVVLVQLGGELRDLLSTDADVVRRVFPVAYPDDPEREEGFQALIRGELIERHQAGIDLITETVADGVLTREQLSTWMTTINAIRLILGTALDVQEDADLDIEPDDPRFPVHQLFLLLGAMLGHILDAFRND